MKPLGRGATSAVFLAEDRFDGGRCVALKVLRPEVAVEQAAREFRILRELRHPGIARALDAGRLPGGKQRYITLEHVEGKDLAKLGPALRKEAGAGQPEQLLETLAQVADALEYLHRRGVLHGDLKPSNVIVADAGVKLIDLGLGGAAGRAGTVAATGTMSFMAPEVFDGGRVDRGADLYALGVTLVWAFSGKYPIRGKSVDEAAHRHRHDLPALPRGMPESVERIALKLLAKSPRHRFASAADVARALREAAGSPASPPMATEAEPLFVGRRRELDQFFEWLTGLERGGSPRVLTIEGEAGAGKSRFLDVVTTELLLAGARVLPVACHGGRDEHGLRSILEKALILDPPSPEEKASFRFLLTAIGQSADAAMRRELERADLHQVQSRLCHEALELLAQRARDPLILLVEDIHRADAQLRNFIARLEADSASGVDTARLAVVATSLPPAPAKSAEQNTSGPAGRTLRLEPLQLADVAAALESVRPGADRAEAKRLLEATGGHAGLLAHRLREGLNADAQPPRSSKALRDRIAELDGAARKLCLVLSLLDHPVARDRLTVLSGLGGKDLAASRRVLEGLGLAGGSADVCYLQVDAATACLERCGADAVRAARVALGRTLLQRCGEPVEAAHQLLQAEDAKLGIPAARSAVQKLREAGRLDEATSLLHRAAAARPDGELLELLGDLEDKCGRFDAAEEAHRKALAVRGLRRGIRPRLLRKLGGALQRRGASAEARSRFEEALASLSGRDADERLRILRELAGLELFSGDPEASVRLARQGLEVLESAAGSRLDLETKRFHAFQMHTTLGNVHLRRFEYERAADELSLALRLADEAESASSAALILNLLGVAWHQANRLDEALRVYRRAESLAERLGDATALFSVHCNVATIQARLGDFTSAESTLRRAESLPLAARSDRARLYLLHSRGLVQRLLLEDSRATWEECIRRADALPEPLFSAYGRVYLLENEMQAGRWGEARRILGDLASLPSDDSLGRAVEARRALLDALCGEPSAAEAVRRASTWPERSDHAGLLEQMILAAARMELGDHVEAERQLESARTAFRKSAQGPSSFHCSMLLVDLALRSGAAPRARARLAEARDELQLQPGLSASKQPAAMLAALEARLCLLEGDLSGFRRAHESAIHLAQGGPLEAGWLLDLVAAAAGEPEAVTRLRASQRAFLRGLSAEDRESYSGRDHRKRLGISSASQQSLAPPSRDNGPRAVEGRYAGLLGVRSAKDARQALHVIVTALGAGRGAIFFDADPGADFTDGRFAGGAKALAKLRTAVQRAGTGSVASGQCAAIRLPGARRGGVIYVEPVEPGSEESVAEFLDTAGIVLGSTLHFLFEEAKDGTVAAPMTTRTRTLSENTFLSSESPRMRELLALIPRLRDSRLPVLLSGESGVGKDQLAHWIHASSARRKKPFVVQDCSAIPPGLLEAEIFGYEPGAFTGARQSRKGCLVAAHEGTFYLDNVDSLSLEVQGKLSRVLAGQAFRPLGGSQTVQVDVRFLASSQRDLESLCGRDEFRKDFFFRLAGVSLHIPPLRERAEDIPGLVVHFQRQVRESGLEFSPEAIDALKAHTWPGNVRELESVVRRLALTSEGVVHAEQVARILGHGGPRALFPRWVFEGRTYNEAIEVAKREYLLHAFERCGGDITRMAAELGTTRRNVYLRLSQLGVSAAQLRSQGQDDEPTGRR